MLYCKINKQPHVALLLFNNLSCMYTRGPQPQGRKGSVVVVVVSVVAPIEGHTVFYQPTPFPHNNHDYIAIKNYIGAALA